MIKSQAYIPGVFLLLIACATSSSGPASAPSVPLPPSSHPSPSSIIKQGTWLLTPDSQAQMYSSSLTTVVYQTDSPNVRQDTFTTKIKFSISQRRTPDSIVWTGIITDFTAEPYLTTGFDTKLLHFPLSFAGTFKNHQLNFNNQNQDHSPSTVCDPSGLPLAIVQKLSFILPYQLTQGQPWQDTTNSTFCAGLIPLTVTVFRTYQILGTTDLPEGTALTISENERAFSRGEGSQDQHRISLQGSATTIRKLNVDSTSGNLISSEALTKALLTIQTSGKTQSFTQTISETTKRSN